MSCKSCSVTGALNRFIDWNSKTTFDVKTRFGLASQVSNPTALDTIKKVTKMFFAVVTSLILTPFSLAVSAFNLAKEKVLNLFKKNPPVKTATT